VKSKHPEVPVLPVVPLEPDVAPAPVVPVPPTAPTVPAVVPEEFVVPAVPDAEPLPAALEEPEGCSEGWTMNSQPASASAATAHDSRAIFMAGE